MRKSKITRVWNFHPFVVFRIIVQESIKNIENINKIVKDEKSYIVNFDRSVEFYSLDVILVVGYRKISKKVFEFNKIDIKLIHKILDYYRLG
jgi:hypothetical protein